MMPDNDAGLPAVILLYIAGATSVTGIIVNGVRTAVALPALVAFVGACVLGFCFVVLFQIANGDQMTPALWAGSVIAGVMVGGAAAGSNAVHSRSKSTTPPIDGEATDAVARPDAIPALDYEQLATAIEKARAERIDARLRERAAV